MGKGAPVGVPHSLAGARKQSRTRTASVVFAGFCAFVTLYAPQPLLPMLAREFGSSAAAVSLIVTASTLAVAVAAPFAGAAADRFGRKRVIVWSAFLLAAPILIAAEAGILRQLLFWRFWQGVFTPGIFAVTIAYINEEWKEGVGAAMSAYVAGTVIGGFSGRMVAALVAAQAGWRWSFVVLAVLDAGCALAMARWMPPDSQRSRRPSAVREVVRATIRGMGEHLANPRLLATYAVGFGVLFTLIATFTYVNFYLAAPPFGLGTTALGLLFTVYLAGAAITPVGGRAIDRLGHRWALVAAFGGGMIGMALTLIHHLPAVLAGLALCCSGVFIAHSAASSYVGAVAREARAAAVGLYAMFYYAGGSLGAALPGYFWNRGGWLACVLNVVAIQAVTIVLALIFWKAQPRLTIPETRQASPVGG